MEITVVGTGTVVPRLSRRQSCVVVRVGGEMLVFDLGSGAVRGMLHAGLDPFATERIFFTHFHPDHTVDVVPLLFAMNYGSDEKRTRPLAISGPEPFRSFWDSITEVWGEWILGDYPLDVSELPHECPAPLELPGYRISWAPAKHRPESIAYRLETEDKAFVYTGDTEYSASVVELARGAHTAPHRMLLPGRRPDTGPSHPVQRRTHRFRGERGEGRAHPRVPCGGRVRPGGGSTTRVLGRDSSRRGRAEAGSLAVQELAAHSAQRP